VGLPSLIVTRAKKAESKSQVYLALFIVPWTHIHRASCL
jgi:hypothetical protein